MKLARIRTCQRCQHWRAGPANVWRWPHCLFHAAQGDPRGELELSGGFMESGDCPAGYWDSLQPVDVEELRRKTEAAKDESQRRVLKPLVALGLRKLAAVREELQVDTRLGAALRTSLADRLTQAQCDLLVEYVREGGLRPSVAQELAAEQGLDLDAPA